MKRWLKYFCVPFFFTYSCQNLLAVDFSNPGAQQIYWNKLGSKLGGRDILEKFLSLSSPQSLIFEGYLRLDPKLSLDEQKSLIKDWLRKNYYADVIFWDNREKSNLEIQALNIMEKGGFSLSNSWSCEKKLEYLISWNEVNFGYKEVLSSDDSYLTAKQRAKRMLLKSQEKRAAEDLVLLKIKVKKDSRSCWSRVCF